MKYIAPSPSLLSWVISDDGDVDEAYRMTACLPAGFVELIFKFETLKFEAATSSVTIRSATG